MARRIFQQTPTPMDVDSTGISSVNRQMSVTALDQTIFVKSDGGDVEVTSDPQIEPHEIVGAEVMLVGMSNSDKLILKNNPGGNLKLSGTAELGLNCILELIWCGDNYIEIGRNF